MLGDFVTQGNDSSVLKRSSVCQPPLQFDFYPNLPLFILPLVECHRQRSEWLDEKASLSPVSSETPSRAVTGRKATSSFAASSSSGRTSHDTAQTESLFAIVSRFMFPCKLHREDALVGAELASRLHLQLPIRDHTDAASSSMSSPIEGFNPFWNPERALIGEDESAAEAGSSGRAAMALSTFERVIAGHPPVLESLLAQLPTVSILALFHTSSYLRRFLKAYPLAWKTLSFRLPPMVGNFGSSPAGTDTPDGKKEHDKYHPLNDLLFDIIIPLATRLRSLDLCNTSISGSDLFCVVMYPMHDTIQHLSVRGCKEVSIKYHIVPFLRRGKKKGNLALQSLYTYRCRHHRRRPYLPSSLVRRDSDSEPTHELIELCHEMEIWTDTAWCPTPGGRCFRRKEYHGNRAAPGTSEVWVPFDRLWRSGNRIGPSENASKHKSSDGRLWEDADFGYDGEPLGTKNYLTMGEGKDVPVHLRKSHTTFVDDIRCDQCGDKILERCETCSIRMHCMGCRKTLCASCAFDRPLPKKRRRVRGLEELLSGIAGSAFAMPNNTAPSTPSSSQGPSQNSQIANRRRRKTKFWWAPGASRSPNLMSEQPSQDDTSDSDDPGSSTSTIGLPPPNAPPRLNMHWCCLEPIFSGGGGVAFLGPQLGGAGSDRIRAVPLPRRKEYVDPDFSQPSGIIWGESKLREGGMKNMHLYESIMGENVDILPYLKQESLELQAQTCPRSLCKDCYRSFRWKVGCRACKKPLCKEHDFRALKVRKCGFRDLNVEREFVRNPPSPPLQPKGMKELRIPAFGEKRVVEEPAPEPEPSSSPQPSFDIPMDDDLIRPIPMDREESVASNANSIALLAPPPNPIPTATSRPSSTAPPDLSSSIADLRSNPIPRRSSSRGRSLSLSGLDSRTRGSSASAAEQQRLPLPCNPGHPVQWQGCGAYFCPQVRPVGDCRGRCTAAMHECAECGVLVCEVCYNNLLDAPAYENFGADVVTVASYTSTYWIDGANDDQFCDQGDKCGCSFCGGTFHCPVCRELGRVRERCTAEEERRAREEERRIREEREEREREEQRAADELAEAVGDFYEGLGVEWWS